MNISDPNSPHKNPPPEELLKLGVAVSGLGLGTVDYVADTIVLDERAASLFDLPADTPIPRPELHARIHAEDRLDVEKKLSCLLDPNQDGFIDVQHRVVHRDGTQLWLQARKQVWFSDPANGAPALPKSGMVAIQDISAHMAAQDHIQFLMDEMNHRVKNAMGVVQGMARLTAASDEEREFAMRFSDRLKGLSFNHDALVKSNWSSVDLKDLVEFHMAAFIEKAAGRVVIDGSAMKLKPAAAQAIGMALHELATNAVKYGALSNETGQISIAWQTMSDEDETFRIAWEEAGGPPVSSPRRQGFGQKVLESMAAASVDGSVELKYEASGVKWKLDAPATAIMV